IATTGLPLSALARPLIPSYQRCKKRYLNGTHLRMKRLGVTFKSFDVVAVPFPFTDRDATKRRPALVISNENFNQQHNQVVLAMITTTTDNVWPSDVSFANWQKAGLKVACQFRLKLFTLDQSLVLKSIGHLSSKDVKSVKAALAEYIDFG
ncbi:MAG: type II toxin-antitoxin system PemK/MazF family toxin, partial [Gallionella sp.]